MLKDALYTNILNLSCIFLSFFFLLWVATLSLFLPFFFFWAIMLPVHFFFSWVLTLPLSLLLLFFLIFFSFDFLGLGSDSLFLFLLDVIFFGTCFCVIICHFKKKKINLASFFNKSI